MASSAVLLTSITSVPQDICSSISPKPSWSGKDLYYWSQIASCCQRHCSSHRCRVWPRCHARQWAVNAATCQQSCLDLFLPHWSTETGLSTSSIGRRSQAYVSIRVEQAWLLQRCVSQPDKVNYCTTPTRTECGSRTCFTCWATRSHDVCSTTSTLAPCSTANHLQAVSSDASCQHQMYSVILDGVCHSNSCTRFKVTSLLYKQLLLPTTTYTEKVRQMCFRFC